MTITERNLLQRGAVERIEINRAFQATHRLFLFALAALDVTLQLEYSGVIGQGFSGDLQFGKGSVIIQESTIKVSRAHEVHFASFGMQPQRLLKEAKCT